MKETFLLIFIFCVSNHVHSKEINLLCRGTVTIKSGTNSEIYKNDINFSFDDIKKTITTDRSLMCVNSQLKIIRQQFTNQYIEIDKETADKELNDNDYCLHSFNLNRNSGLLKTVKIENLQRVPFFSSGNFNCELAKQKF